MWLTSNISCPLEFYASFQDNIREYTMETDSDEMIRLVGENTRFAAREIASEPEFTIQTLHSRLQTMSSLCIASMYIDVQNLKIWSPLISIINYSIYLIFKIFLSRINLFLPFFFSQIFTTILSYWNEGGRDSNLWNNFGRFFSFLDKNT